jgi:hypothetical protein
VTTVKACGATTQSRSCDAPSMSAIDSAFAPLVAALRRAGEQTHADRLTRGYKPAGSLRRAILHVAHRILVDGATDARADALTLLLLAVDATGKRQQIDAALAHQRAGYARRFPE